MIKNKKYAFKVQTQTHLITKSTIDQDYITNCPLEEVSVKQILYLHMQNRSSPVHGHRSIIFMKIQNVYNEKLNRV